MVAERALTTIQPGGIAQAPRVLMPDAVVTIDGDVVQLICDKETRATPPVVALVRDAVMRYGIPITGMNVLGGKLYVNAAGLFFIADHNPDPRRRVKSLTYDWIELPTKENGWVGGVKARAELWDGSVFMNEGWIDPETEKLPAMRTLSNYRHKVLTKAFARVLRVATGIGLTAVEEMGDRPEVATMPSGWQAPQLPADDARKRFFAVAKGEPFNLATQKAIHLALGLPPEPGALAAFAAEHGWDLARTLLEDGRTVPQFLAERAGSRNGPSIVGSKQEAGPGPSPEDAFSIRAAELGFTPEAARAEITRQFEDAPFGEIAEQFGFPMLIELLENAASGPEAQQPALMETAGGDPVNGRRTR